MYCILCQQNINNSNKILCNQCYTQFFSKNIWHGCARCGENECINCEQLSEFSSVTSLLRLTSQSAALLLAAKDRNNLASIELFEALLRTIIKVKLRNFLPSLTRPHLLLSPLRAERVKTSLWHPLTLFKKIALELEASYGEALLKGAPRQTFLPKALRNSEHNSQQKIILFNNTLRKELYSDIIFIDDVITSGTSAVRTFELLKQKFPGAKWHIFTIFRTPSIKKTCKNNKICKLIPD